ncbi:MAG: TRAP transporter large permease subunit [Chloroflexi bacterium]|nr:TRAP transporter large permease subunit [Chloroflexota bacterium]
MEISPLLLAAASTGLVIIMLAVGVPVWASLGVTGLIGVILLQTWSKTMSLLAYFPFSVMETYTWTVVPLFVWMGHMAFFGGISHGAFDIGRAWLGRLRGGLAMGTIFACALFGACCGSSVASAATMGRVAIPEMKASGYNNKLAAGTVAAGGLLAIMIPPSITLVIYGVITETSIGQLLIAGIIPGFLSALIFMLGIFFITWRRPEQAPPVRIQITWRDRFMVLRKGYGIVVLFTVVLGGIYLGIVTTTEAAALGVLAAFIIVVATQRRGIFKITKDSAQETLGTTAMLFLIIIGASLYTWFMVTAGVPQALARWVATLNVSPYIILLLFLSVYIPLGCFLDPQSIQIITLPIMFPILVGQLGFNAIWLGVLTVKLIEISLLTPPVGLNCFTIAGVAPDIKLTDVFVGSSWFIAFEGISFGLLLAFPALSTWLPELM